MNHKITLEYVKALHKNAVNLEEKIIYLVSIIDELVYFEIISMNEKSSMGEYYKSLIDIRNNLIHLRKNSLDSDVWNNRQVIYDRITSIILNHL